MSDSTIPRTDDLDGWFTEFVNRDRGEPLSDLDMAYIRLMKRWADKGRRNSSQQMMVALEAEGLKNQTHRLLKALQAREDDE